MNRAFQSKWKGKRFNKDSISRWSLDLWLPRLSHFSQFGLFVITLGSLYFVVLPLYQKSILEEAIARKEIELKDAEKVLEGSYVRLRKYAVHRFVASAGYQCSGIFNDVKVDPKLLKLNPLHGTAFEINFSKCVADELTSLGTLQDLRIQDQRTLLNRVQHLGAEMEKMKIVLRDEYLSLPERAKRNPTILDPPGEFAERTLEIMPRLFMKPEVLEEERRWFALRSTLRRIEGKLGAHCRELLLELREEKWDANP